MCGKREYKRPLLWMEKCNELTLKNEKNECLTTPQHKKKLGVEQMVFYS